MDDLIKLLYGKMCLYIVVSENEKERKKKKSLAHPCLFIEGYYIYTYVL